MKECVVVLKDCIVPNVEKERSSVFIIKMNMQITNEDMTIFEKMWYRKWQEKDSHHEGNSEA